MCVIVLVIGAPNVKKNVSGLIQNAFKCSVFYQNIIQ